MGFVKRNWKAVPAGVEAVVGLGRFNVEQRKSDRVGRFDEGMGRDGGAHAAQAEGLRADRPLTPRP